MKNIFAIRFASLFVVTLAGVSTGFCAHAAKPLPTLFTSNGKVVQTYPSIPAGAHAVLADVGNDGIPEIIVGAPAGQKSYVSIFRLNGSRIRTIRMGGVKGTPGVRVAVANVNTSPEKEIVASFGNGVSPEVRVYSPSGQRVKTFLAFGKGFRGGVQVTTGDINGDGIAEIISAPGAGGGPFVVAHNGAGEKMLQFSAYANSVRSGVQIFAGDINGDGQIEIATATSAKAQPVKIFTRTGNLHASFVQRKVQTASVSMHASAATGTVILGVTAGADPKVSSYTPTGEAGDIQFYPYGKKFQGEVRVSSFDTNNDGEQELLVVPTLNVSTGGAKRIVVDISDQRMYRYEGNALVATHVVSTGKWSMPTPLGNHAVHNKLTTAYSKKYALYMDNWMAITPDGAYGIHSLPYWRLQNGGVYYEGVHHLGLRVSHGCIRLSPQESKTVFAWTSVGTSVQVVN